MIFLRRAKIETLTNCANDHEKGKFPWIKWIIYVYTLYNT